MSIRTLANGEQWSSEVTVSWRCVRPSYAALAIGVREPPRVLYDEQTFQQYVRGVEAGCVANPEPPEGER